MAAPPLWEAALRAKLKIPTVNDYFGKRFEGPTFGKDTYALPAWVARAADFNRFARERAEEHEEYGETRSAKYWRDAFIQRPAKGIERIWAKARNLNEGKTHSPSTTEQKRKIWGDRIKGQKGDLYRQGLSDPNRPMSDMTGERVSPEGYHPRTGYPRTD